MPNALPIRFINEQGVDTGDCLDGAPLIRTAFMYDPLFGQPRDPNSPERWVRDYTQLDGLVDTGAAMSVADRALIAKHGCPLVGTKLISTITGPEEVSMHKCHLLFPDIGRMIEIEVAGASLRSSVRNFDLILGCTFLDLGVLMMDFPARQFSFTLS
ncbi:hypothetical protein [Methylorubrum aminovorans]|uniref:hypothetical protein n=1 Tax=Methylorubrum aminovorans TaxID=269069 RepID=UPI001EDFFF6C|nr:hypothetical protein [Methylorubrum aminovorans]GMA74368.1 hypothetical protein GCM10025880_07850 [Methylorubrum aminovorans]